MKYCIEVFTYKDNKQKGILFSHRLEVQEGKKIIINVAKHINLKY